MSAEPFAVCVRNIARAAIDISSYELVDPAGKPLPVFTAGAHIDLRIEGLGVRQYSLFNSPEETYRYRIAVRRDQHGRGGSRYIHDQVGVGDMLVISKPRNNFPLDESADHHLFIAGGIGITPIMAMLARVREIKADFSLHYCTRSPKHTAFLEDIKTMSAQHPVHVYHDGGIPEHGLNVRGILANARAGTHVYCCGPEGLINAVTRTAADWPSESIHIERFSPVQSSLSADSIGGTFEIKIASTGVILDVPADRTILQVLREHGINVESLCEAGVCGTCRTRFVSGEPDHRDQVLLPDEQREFLMVCVSRSKSSMLVLDL